MKKNAHALKTGRGLDNWVQFLNMLMPVMFTAFDRDLRRNWRNVRYGYPKCDDLGKIPILRGDWDRRKALSPTMGGFPEMVR